MYIDYLRHSEYDRVRHGRHMKAWLKKQATRLGSTPETIYNALLHGYSADQIEGYVGAPPVNTAVPVVSGSKVVGGTLSTTNGTWTGSAITYGYQWYRGSTLIAGATGQTYVTKAADVGASLKCNVIGTSPAGMATAQSALYGPITSTE